MLMDSAKVQIDVTVSQHAPLGLKTGFKMGSQENQAEFWSEQDLEVKSVEPQDQESKQARPGQAKTKQRGLEKSGRRGVKSPSGRER